MEKKKLLLRIVALMLLIFGLEQLSHKFYLYNSIWWFDMPMHFLGGFWVSLFFCYVFIDKTPKVADSLMKVMIYVLAIGISWELFEFYSNNYIGHENFDALDTLADLFFDISGGFCAILYLWKKQPR